MDSENTLDVTRIENRLKHSTIFDRLKELRDGESLIIYNDHDPKPLYYQLLHEYPGRYAWSYQEEGPVDWRVRIFKKEIQVEDAQDTVGEIAALDYRKAEVFKKFGIDFCCGGEKQLAVACREVGVSETELRQALDEATKANNAVSQNYNSWPVGFLADFIQNTHHQYTREVGEMLEGLAQKVAYHHGENHPELTTLSDKVYCIFQDLLTHMELEEEQLFPKIRQLSSGEKGDGEMKRLIEDMHMDHDHAGDDVKYLRGITNNYELPSDACNSYKLLFEKLQEFEADLFRHIHLENNILFPKTLALERQHA